MEPTNPNDPNQGQQMPPVDPTVQAPVQDPNAGAMPAPAAPEPMSGPAPVETPAPPVEPVTAPQGGVEEPLQAPAAEMPAAAPSEGGDNNTGDMPTV